MYRNGAMTDMVIIAVYHNIILSVHLLVASVCCVGVVGSVARTSAKSLSVTCGITSTVSKTMVSDYHSIYNKKIAHIKKKLYLCKKL